jgi:hypothetical protein
VYDHPEPLERYLSALFARARPSTLIEIRWRVPDGMQQRFIPAAQAATAAQTVRELAEGTDVYVGALPRWRPSGARAAVVGDGRTVWVDLDSDVAARALEPVEPAPSLIVGSGGPGHLHAYWSLRRGVPPAQIERANRRLAWALGGDLNSTDAARILRPPQTVHHGRQGAPVVLLEADPSRRCRLGDLVGGLPDPPTAKAHPSQRPDRGRAERGDALLGVAPERYVRALTGQDVGRSRKVHCPLHEDSTPSLHVYRDARRGWFCFGCRRGGSVYDLAAALWHIEPRGSGFAALREGLREVLGLPDQSRR